VHPGFRHLDFQSWYSSMGAICRTMPPWFRPSNYLLSYEKYQYGSCGYSSSNPDRLGNSCNFALLATEAAPVPSRRRFVSGILLARCLFVSGMSPARRCLPISCPVGPAARTLHGSKRGCRSSCSRHGARAIPGWFECREHSAFKTHLSFTKLRPQIPNRKRHVGLGSCGRVR